MNARSKGNGRGLYAFRHGFCVALANGYFGDHWERAEARDMMRHTNAKTTDTYYHVLSHRLATKAAQTKPLSNPAEFTHVTPRNRSEKERGDPARTPMVRFAVSRNVNQNNTSLMIMHEYTRRHVHVTSLDLT
ncbi:MAG: hypothetical protein OES69_14845 [Myxococcales bacterium]|nr:hypothetical protein [Myxococcales bacterium]MDH3845218.1 hypothetical protein [Myxococcales bacterium]